MKIFLDDTRNPEQVVSWMQKRIQQASELYLEDWYTVRNYKEFTALVVGNEEEITHISFDHDLGEDCALEFRKLGGSKRHARAIKRCMMSGYDCAKWLKTHYGVLELKLPIMYVHSMNPVGTENIIKLFQADYDDLPF